ncbi:MAG TPA: septal ring lytic transglycosylase RlpA family protein [Flavobacterium sp.]|nr:septal ring lytic transglycosylase RlpA family protein [Flavobacterium sp.]
MRLRLRIVAVCVFLVSLLGYGLVPAGHIRLQQPKGKQDSIVSDSIVLSGKYRFKLLKKNAHASYYADRLNGRRTASGRVFSNSKYTAAHRKLPFGTKVRVTNEANGKSVIIEITDRGPFTKGRDIDLSKRAFMDIAGGSRYGGSLRVTLEVVQP